MDPNWSRWIFASITTFFDSKKGNFPLYVEGSDKLGRREEKDYGELRLNGPFATELSMNFWELLFDVNVIISSMKDSTDIHRIYRSIGTVTQMFEKQIQIFRLGNGPRDDQSFLECALLEMEGRSGGVLINHFGQFDPSLPVLQASLEGTYKLFITL